MPKSYAVPPPPHHNEGKTVAAWTMNLGIVVGSVPIAAGMILQDMTFLIWVGVALLALFIVVGLVMSKAGLGQPRHYPEPLGEAVAVNDSTAPARRTAEADAR